LGVLRLGIELGYRGGWINNSLLVQFATINFLHFAVILFAFSSLVLVSFSLFPAGILQLDSAAVNLPAVWRDFPPQFRYRWWNRLNIVFSILLFLVVVGLWSYFF
ncbi:MAG: hypothetical protein WAN36_06045, partial [Calditrichia bacterium]